MELLHQSRKKWELIFERLLNESIIGKTTGYYWTCMHLVDVKIKDECLKELKHRTAVPAPESNEKRLAFWASMQQHSEKNTSYNG